MAARYVFWRTPAGSPSKGDGNKYAPCELLASVGRSASVNKAGSISWGGLSFIRLEQAILGSAVVIDPARRELNRNDAHGILSTAMQSLVKRQRGQSPLEAAALIKQSDNEAAAFFRRKPDSYVLVTSLSVASFPAKKITVDGCRFAPLRNRNRYPYPKVLQLQRSTTLRSAATDSARQQLVRIAIVGRSVYEAVDRALTAANLLCGLWNLFATYGAWSMEFGRQKRKPLGVIHVGPTHTLHNRDGTPVDDVYWYELGYAEHAAPFKPNKGWEPIEKQRRWAMTRLRHLPYGNDLRPLICRYAEALSKADRYVAFLHMWSVLEAITDTIGKRYDETVSRATWMFKDRSVASELLKYVRLCRNQYVHAARSDDDGHQVAQLVRQFIEPHLLWLLRNDFRVGSLEEYASCLSLPTCVDELRRRQRRLRRAIRLLP